MPDRQFPFCAVYKSGSEYKWKPVPAETRLEAMRLAILDENSERGVVLGIHLLLTQGFPPPDEYMGDDKDKVKIHTESSELDEWCEVIKQSAIEYSQKREAIKSKMKLRMEAL